MALNAAASLFKAGQANSERCIHNGQGFPAQLLLKARAQAPACYEKVTDASNGRRRGSFGQPCSTSGTRNRVSDMLFVKQGPANRHDVVDAIPQQRMTRRPSVPIRGVFTPDPLAWAVEGAGRSPAFQLSKNGQRHSRKQRGKRAAH